MKLLYLDFGKIYTAGREPRYGVYRTSDVHRNHEAASAISHHWEEAEAQRAAVMENKLSGRKHEVVAYGKPPVVVIARKPLRAPTRWW